MDGLLVFKTWKKTFTTRVHAIMRISKWRPLLSFNERTQPAVSAVSEKHGCRIFDVHILTLTVAFL